MNELLIREATADDRLPLSRMLELYQHELSDIWDQDLDLHGEYGYALDDYWQTEGFHAYVATVNGKFAGFALVSRHVRVGTDGWWMDQFFVMKKYRRAAVGRALAHRVFVDLRGRWEVGQMQENHPAQEFWRQVIGDFTAGQYREKELSTGWWRGIVQIFESAAER